MKHTVITSALLLVLSLQTPMYARNDNHINFMSAAFICEDYIKASGDSRYIARYNLPKEKVRAITKDLKQCQSITQDYFDFLDMQLSFSIPQQKADFEKEDEFISKMIRKYPFIFSH